MIINEKIENNLIKLNEQVETVLSSNSLTDLQIENFLITFEKARYNILEEIKIHNRSVEFEYEKIKTIDDRYKAELNNGVLKIYVPEVMPSFKNLKTQTHKRVLLNVERITRQFANTFENEVCIFVKIFENTLGWDIDNRYIKPIADALILSKVIQDDNMTKMMYCAKGEYSDDPHTEIFVFDCKKITNFLENVISENREF